MRVKVPYPVWRRVRYQLKLLRLPNSIVNGHQVRNYIKYLAPRTHYPRIHFTVSELQQPIRFVVVFFHIDLQPEDGKHHPESDIFSPHLQRIKNLFENS